MTRRPGPFLARVLRAPTRLYDWHLGWLLGNRFLRLTHRGRITGHLHHTVLEVLAHDPTTDEFVVMAGLGRRADWWRNIEAGGAVSVAVGTRTFTPIARELAVDEAGRALAGYEATHPLARPLVRAVLSTLTTVTYDGTPDSRARLLAVVPVVALTPRRGPASSLRPAPDGSRPGGR